MNEKTPWLREGFSRWNLATSLYGSFATLGVTTFLNFVQPFLLNEVFHIPPERQGELTGLLQTTQEIVVILLMGVAGALSDRTGRRVLWVAGLLIIGAVYVVYPLAQTELQLYLLRIAMGVAVGIGPIMILACLFDYTRSEVHGRIVGINSVVIALGVLAMALILSRLPAWFVERGASSQSAANFSMWIAGGLAAFSALILRLGLADRRSNDSTDQESWVAKLRQGVGAVARKRELHLAIAGSFIGRGDFTVIGVFFSLWVVQAGAEIGISSTEGLVRAGTLFAVIQLSALLWGYLMGRICDYLLPSNAVILAGILACLGYLAIGLGDNPFSVMIYPIAVLLGMGEISVVVASSSLLGKSAPPEAKGAVVGLYGLAGGLSILFVSLVGGQLFDKLDRSAPFLMMALMNMLLCVFAAWVTLKSGRSLLAKSPVPSPQAEI